MKDFLFTNDAKDWADYLARAELADPASLTFDKTTIVRMGGLWGWIGRDMTDTTYAIEVTVKAGTTLRDAMNMIWDRYVKVMELHGATPRELFYEGYTFTERDFADRVEVLWGS